MNKPFFYKTSLIRALITTGLTLGIGLATIPANADDSTAPQAHSDSIGATIDDAVITTKVKAELMDRTSLKKSDIHVTTTNGVVTLEGTASSSKAKSVAEAAVKSVEGVKSIDDNLTTPSSSATSAKAHKVMKKTERVVADSWITTKVKTDILASSLDKGMDVSVDTVHGVVVLKGTLTNQDAIDHVRDIAEKVDGVKSVDISGLTVAKP
ncbi:MAG: BON domain-containing protein [Betaproteobacteria bacterium]|nr:BON domain-containing protein [Betaproteobacteria bacterium]